MHHVAVAIEPSVYGTGIIQGRKALEKMVGVEVVARAVSSLPREDASAYDGVTALDWLPVRIVDAVMYAVAEASGWTPERISREAARIGIDSLMNGLWRVILRFTSDKALVARTPLIYSKTYNVGRLESVFPRRGVANLTHTGWPAITELQLVGLASAIETVLRCAGREDAKVTYERTPTGASFAAKWSA